MRFSRSFSKNTSNYMSLGIGAINPLVNGAAYTSAHCFVWFNSADAGSTANRFFGNILNGTGTLGFTLGVDGTGFVLKSSNRSQSADSTQTTGASGRRALGPGKWHSVGFLIDYAGKAVYLYADGKLDSITTVTYGANSYTAGTASTNNDTIGSNVTVPASTASQHDGYISEVAIWKVPLFLRDFIKLGKGTPANRIGKPPVFYMKLNGIASPEICSVGSGVSGTITGTIPSVMGPRMTTYTDHPAV